MAAAHHELPAVLRTRRDRARVDAQSDPGDGVSSAPRCDFRARSGADALDRRSRSMSARSDSERWSAVVARDAGQDGRFVYAVRTTGVYCKPSCASRRALRENVSFFADPDAAEAAGFRACKRCDPRATESATSRVIAKA